MRVIGGLYNPPVILILIIAVLYYRRVSRAENFVRYDRFI